MTFDLVAPFYDLLARLAFGRSLIRAQQWGIDQVRSGSRVLVLGGGTGATVPDLLARQPAHILFVEASAVMLAKARQRTPPLAPIEFIVGTEAALAHHHQVDYIVLPFVLDVYPIETLLAHMLPTLLQHLRPDGQLIVTDFNQPRAVLAARLYVADASLLQTDHRHSGATLDQLAPCPAAGWPHRNRWPIVSLRTAAVWLLGTRGGYRVAMFERVADQVRVVASSGATGRRPPAY